MDVVLYKSKCWVLSSIIFRRGCLPFKKPKKKKAVDMSNYGVRPSTCVGKLSCCAALTLPLNPTVSDVDSQYPPPALHPAQCSCVIFSNSSNKLHLLLLNCGHDSQNAVKTKVPPPLLADQIVSLPPIATDSSQQGAS